MRVKLPLTPINGHQGLKSRNLKHPWVKLAWCRKPSNQSGIDKVTTLVSRTVQHMEISLSFITNCSHTFFLPETNNLCWHLQQLSLPVCVIDSYNT